MRPKKKRSNFNDENAKHALFTHKYESSVYVRVCVCITKKDLTQGIMSVFVVVFVVRV